MLSDLYTKVDEFVQKMLNWDNQQNSAVIHSLYLTGDLAMHRVSPQTNVQLLLILETENSECFPLLSKWSDPSVEVKVIQTPHLTFLCPFDQQHFQKARLLWGKSLYVEAPTMPWDEEVVILRERLTTKLTQAHAHPDESLQAAGPGIIVNACALVGFRNASQIQDALLQEEPLSPEECQWIREIFAGIAQEIGIFTVYKEEKQAWNENYLSSS